MADRELQIILRLKDELSKELSGVQANVQKLQPAFKQMAFVGTAAFGTISGIAVSSLKEFAESEKQATIANQALENALKGMENGGTILKNVVVGQHDVATSLKNTGVEADKLRSEIERENITISESKAKLKSLADQLDDGKISHSEYALATAKTNNAIKASRIDIQRYTEALGEQNTKKVDTIETIKVQVSSLEDARAAMQEAGKAALKLGFDDDTARISFAKLFAVTQQVTKAQADMKLAMDLSAFSGRSLEDSAAAITKVHAGATRILKEFGIELDADATAQEALSVLQERTAGTAERLASTIEGQSRVLTEQFNNLKEQIGGALAPALASLFQSITPVVERFTEWAANNPELLARILLLAGGIAGLVAVVGTLGLLLPALITGFTALAAVVAFIATSPLILLIAGFAVLAAALKDQIAELFGVEVTWRDVWTEIQSVFGSVVDWMSDKILWLMDKFEQLKQTIASIPDAVRSAVKSAASIAAKVAIPGLGAASSIFKVLPFAEGGIVTKPTLGLVGEAGPEAIIPLSKLGSAGSNITVNVYGDVTGNELIEKVKQSLARELKLSLAL